jgi:large subunit ribosomal protein L22
MPGVKTNEIPGTRAVLRHYRMSAYKARQVLDLVRGKDVDRAAEILQSTPREGARVVGKVLASAVANARNNDLLDPDDLYVSACYADEGTTIKRWRPRADQTTAVRSRRVAASRRSTASAGAEASPTAGDDLSTEPTDPDSAEDITDVEDTEEVDATVEVESEEQETAPDATSESDDDTSDEAEPAAAASAEGADDTGDAEDAGDAGTGAAGTKPAAADAEEKD